MATVDPKRVSDGMLSCDGGMDSGRAPNLLAPNQLAFMVNCTVRGGWPKPRPGLRKLALNFGDQEGLEDNFTTGNFQFAGAYQGDDGNLHLISMHGGRVFRATVGATSLAVQDISITGDLNPSNRPIAWGIQAENYFLIQDGQSKCFIYNGSASRRAGLNEVPVGRQMGYIMNRLFVANGRTYVIGDIEFGPSGTPALGYRDALLKFTENTFLNEGGSFGVPAAAGNITGIKSIANLDTVLGQGEAIITTDNMIFATQLPPDRATWKSTTQPLQRVIQLNYGSRSQASMINVSGDIYYRAPDGWRSLMYGVRFFGEPGQTPISKEMNRVLERDDPYLLQHCSAVLFDNRLLGTVSPFPTDRGIAHRGMMALDFDLLSSMRGKLPPAYDGLWTGIDILQVVTGFYNGVERAFAFVVGCDSNIEVWEISTSDHFDHESKRIGWSFETRAFNFANNFDLKKLQTTDLFFDELDGTVDFDIKYRPNSYPCWLDLESWTECAKISQCASDDLTACPTFQENKPQNRTKYHTRQPADVFCPIEKTLLRNFFEIQFRHAFVGYCRVKQSRYDAYVQEEGLYRT